MSTGALSQAGEDGPTVHFIDPELLLGSGGTCDIFLKKAAPQHCRVSATPAGYEIKDLTGQGLIRVNGIPVSKGILKAGDDIEVGSEHFTFCLEELAVSIAEEIPGPAGRPPGRTREKSHGPGAARNSIRRGPLPAASTPEEKKKSGLWIALAVGGTAILAVAAPIFLLFRGSGPEMPSPLPQAVPLLARKTDGRALPSPASPPGAPESAAHAGERTVPEAPAVRPRSTAPPGAGSVAPLSPLEASLGSSSFFPAQSPALRNPLSELKVLLRDPARRQSPAERASVLEALKSLPESEVIRVLARQLSRPGGSLDLAGLAGATWTTYLREIDLEKIDAFSPEEHQSAARLLKEGSRASAFLRALELAHLVEALHREPSTSRLLSGAGFREAPESQRWGEPEAIFQYQVARYFLDHRKDDAGLEASALSSMRFGTRYVGLLIEIDRALSRGSGLQATFSHLASAGAPGEIPGAAAHLRALAESFRKAVYCKDCKGGRLVCPQCQGKTHVDLPCPVCKGQGRVTAPGAVDGANVTQKCRNCGGAKVFRQAGCPTCSQSGSVPCTSCGGSPWHENPCTNPTCRGGWVKCDTCHGGGLVDVPCPDCGGTGRVMAPGAALGARVTQKCRTCNEEHGVFRKAAKCQTCQGQGLVRCSVCQGKKGSEKPPVAPLSEVFATEPCSACRGEGWISSRTALPCESCQGLGLRVKPASDPSKSLD